MESGKGSLTIINGAVLSESGIVGNGCVVAQGGKIRYVGRPCLKEGLTGSVVNAEGNYVSPGFIDLHVHGAAGFNFLSGDKLAIDKIEQAHIRYGTTSMLATLATGRLDDIRRGITACREVIEGRPDTIIRGINIEGPFLNAARAGAQSGGDIKETDHRLLSELMDMAGDLLRIQTIAPELDGADELIRKLVGRGVIPAAGHSNASLTESRRAFDNGLGYVTHLFNAMSGLHHRNPGLAAAALMDERVAVELIADGVHVAPVMVDLVLKVKNHENIILVTDCSEALDLEGGRFYVGTGRVEVRAGAPRLNSDVLYGTVLTMNRAVKNIIRFTGLPVEKAVEMASFNPARVLGLDRCKGSLKAGMDADMVVFDKELDVKATIVGGRIRYSKLVPPGGTN